MSENKVQLRNDVWFVYDGDCPMCLAASRALKIRQAVGKLNLLNARTEIQHPIMQEIRSRGLNLDDGMVIKFRDTYYHGADALHIMALLGTHSGWFNRMNALLFRSKMLSTLCYPILRTARTLVLRFKGIPKMHNLDS